MTHGLIPTFFNYSVVGDTHAANLTGSNTQALDSTVASQSGAGDSQAADVAANWLSNDNGAGEVTIITLSAITPTVATNRMVLFGGGRLMKQTANGTMTYRIKESTTTLFSTTSASITNGALGFVTVDGAVTNATVAAHTYTMTVQPNAGTWRNEFCLLYGKDIEMTGSDTHAAQLTGSSGTCQA